MNSTADASNRGTTTSSREPLYTRRPSGQQQCGAVPTSRYCEPGNTTWYEEGSMHSMRADLVASQSRVWPS